MTIINAQNSHAPTQTRVSGETNGIGQKQWYWAKWVYHCFYNRRICPTQSVVVRVVAPSPLTDPTAAATKGAAICLPPPSLPPTPWDSRQAH